MSYQPHGTLTLDAFHHMVLDLRRWTKLFPLDTDLRAPSVVASPSDIAALEQLRARCAKLDDLGPSVVSDVIVWADHGPRNDEGQLAKPWLSRLGGLPWREAGKAWPKDENGIPLTFLGQICFEDSLDRFSFKLPGKVVLFFGKARQGGWWVEPLPDTLQIEWSSLTLKKPCSISDVPWTGQLPYAFDGVLHRTVQYLDRDLVDSACERFGVKHGSHGVGRFQATCIGTYADVPQGWPFVEGDGNTLVAMLSSVSSYSDWPLCDLPTGRPTTLNSKGKEGRAGNHSFHFNIGDGGAIYVYRTRSGAFKVDCACG